MFETWIDGVKVRTTENTQPKRFERVKIHAGDNFYPPVDGKIENFSIKTRHG